MGWTPQCSGHGIDSHPQFDYGPDIGHYYVTAEELTPNMDTHPQFDYAPDIGHYNVAAKALIPSMDFHPKSMAHSLDTTTRQARL